MEKKKTGIQVIVCLIVGGSRVTGVFIFLQGSFVPGGKVEGKTIKSLYQELKTIVLL